MSSETEFLKSVRNSAGAIKKQGEGALNQLNAEEILWTPNEEANSVSILVKHISGNMISRSTDFLTTDGEKEDRDRDSEFEGPLSYDELMNVWENGWNTFLGTLDELEEADLSKDVLIRGESKSVVQALMTQIAHYAGHVGQIVYIAKQIKSSDWETLSIPRGQSESFRQKMLRDNK